jgi:hypothetical protein
MQPTRLCTRGVLAEERLCKKDDQTWRTIGVGQEITIEGQFAVPKIQV